MKKLRVYFNEYNVLMDGVVYLPFASGLLVAYANSFKIIRDSFDFMPFIFVRDSVDNILKKYDNPDIAAFSVSIWNYNLSLAVAKEIKRRFPDCKIIFGGCNATKETKEYPFIDYVLFHEGECQFVKLLGKYIGINMYIPEVKNIDDFPSPYSSGVFDYLFKDNSFLRYQAIVETNRSCPFTCSFCYWGQNFENKKVKFHSLEYIRSEADWLGKNGIKYVFLADANFGMFEQDIEVAKIYNQINKKYSYPEKVRVCYGKNKEDRVFETAKILNANGLSKSVTLAIQSNSVNVLDKIKRKNIKTEVFSNLAKRYSENNIPTYTEIILGLPGETKDSFKDGVDKIIKEPTQLFVYHCSILPNTEMSTNKYLKEHGIKTVRVPLYEVHSLIKPKDDVVEYDNIVVETNHMNKWEWVDCCVYAWVKQVEHNFGMIPSEKEHNCFYDIAINILNGVSRCQVDLRFGNIYWEPEEICFLRMSLDQGLIDGDLKQFAKEKVLWGRKSSLIKKEVVYAI